MVPEECSDIISYTNYPNTVFNLNSTEEYTAFSDNITAALSNCTGLDPYWSRWDVCHMIFPRCIMGFELILCRQNCLGLSYVKSLHFKFRIENMSDNRLFDQGVKCLLIGLTRGTLA